MRDLEMPFDGGRMIVSSLFDMERGTKPASLAFAAAGIAGLIAHSPVGGGGLRGAAAPLPDSWSVAASYRKCGMISWVNTFM